jgi:hypothetical protein
VTISATTRVCPVCTTLLPSEPPHVCPTCSALGVPLLEDWPPFLVAWLHMKRLAAFYAPYARLTAQQRAERLLVSVIAGKQWGSRIVPRAALASDCYVVAVEELAKWKAAGMPDLV